MDKDSLHYKAIFDLKTPSWEGKMYRCTNYALMRIYEVIERSYDEYLSQKFA